MRELYMIKLGGGSITEQNSPRTAKRKEISRLLGEIQEARGEKGFDAIIGHGSGSFGHVVAKEYNVHEGLYNENSAKGAILTKLAASELNSIVLDEALKLGMPVFPFFPSSFLFSSKRKPREGFVGHIANAIEHGFIPVVHGDVVMDDEQGVSIASTEQVLCFIASRMNTKKIIIATDVDGIYDKDPTQWPDANFIESVSSSNIDDVINSTGAAHKVDVTGGMKSKVSLLYEMVKSSDGTTGYIVNAGRPGVLKSALAGDKNVRCTSITK